MNNQEIQDKLTRLSRAICCNKPKIVDELPEGTIGGGFVIFEDELYFWDGDSWEAVGGGSGGSVWGAITGTLSDQLDLQSELDNKQDLLISGTNIVTINGYDLLNSGDYSFDLPSGLGELDEGNGIGWRLVGRNPANYGNIGNNAIDLSFSSGSSSSRGATGVRAFAGGQNVEASGNFSTAFGADTISNADNAMSWGQGNTADGTMTTSFGWGNTTTSLASTTIGSFATLPVGQTSFPFVSTDEQFKIGNGVDASNRSDALVVYKNAIQKQGGVTAANASAMTPQNGMTAYITDTNGTFTSPGFWGYEEGSWKKFTLV